MDLARDHGARCHSSGQRGAVPDVVKEDFDLFVELARKLPEWHVRPELLLERLWGIRGSSREEDPCLKRLSTCIRVLLVQRGSLASSAANSRRIVNIDALKWHVETSYSRDSVRIAQVHMEEFTMQEEIALADLVSTSK